MSVYDELIKLQTIPNAFKHWQTYRADVTNYIISHAKGDSTLAIFGAGACNDFDLSLLSNHFSDITLFDENETAMQTALHTYNLIDSSSIHKHVTDFVGISADDYCDFSNALQSYIRTHGLSSDLNVLTKIAADYLTHFYQNVNLTSLDFGTNCFDYSITFGVHSQLNNTLAQLWHIFTESICQTDTTIIQKISDENNLIIPKFNTAILRATRLASFFGTEIENTYFPGAIQGAYQSISDLREHHIIKEEAITYWPFCERTSKVYKMLLQII